MTMNEHEVKIEKIKILFTTNNDLISRMIRWFTWSDYSHVDFLCPDQQHIIGSVPSTGVARTLLKDRLDKSTKYKVMELLIPIQIDKFDVILKTQLGKKYDYGPIIGFMFRKDWNRENKWFCSELIAWALSEAGIKITSENHWRITPQELLQSPSLSESSLHTNATQD